MKKFPKPHLIVLAALLAFGVTLRGGFMWDDHRMLEQNQRLAFTADNIRHAFGSDPFDQDLNYWRPLQTVSNMADHAVWGLRPFGYHLTNFAFHAASAVLFYFLALQLGFAEAVALCAGLLLAVHPAAVEQLLIIAGRAELASTACSLAALLLFLRGAAAWAFLLFLAALGFKENGAAVPLLAALCLWYLKRDKRDWIKLLPFFAALPVYLWLRHAAIGHGALEKGLAATLSGLALKVPQAVLVYLKVALLPFDMHSHRMRPDFGAHSWAALPALAALLWLAARRGGRTGLFLAGWYLVNLAPKLPLLATNDLMIDHWVYLANGALFISAGLLYARLPGGEARAAPLLLTLLLACTSAWNARDRSTDLENYERAAARSTSKPMLYNLAREYFLLGRAEESRALLEKIAAAAPDTPIYLDGLALARARTGDLAGALEASDRALALKPGDPELLMNRQAILKLSGDADALNEMGILRARAGELDKAEALFLKALALKPGLESARQNLARVRQMKSAGGQPAPSQRQ